MKIAVNARMLDDNHLEGIGRFAYEILVRMVKKHPEDKFILFYDQKAIPLFSEFNNVEYYKIGLPARVPYLWKRWFEKSLRDALIKYKIDVLFSPESYTCLCTNIPRLITTHDLAFEHYPEFNKRSHHSYFRKFLPLFHHHASAIACVSQFTKSDIIEKYGIEESKITVVHNATSSIYYPLNDVDKEIFIRKYDFNKPYFLYLGSLHPRKNIVKLLEAFELFKQRSHSENQLVLSGRFAWNYRDIKKRIENSPYKNDIRHLGYFSGDTNALINCATALCYVSLFEGFGIPILEAMAAGTPVICSNVSSMPEVAGQAAHLVNPHDSIDIASAMEQVNNNQTYRKSLSEKGLLRSAQFSWDHSANKLYSKLKEIAT